MMLTLHLHKVLTFCLAFIVLFSTDSRSKVCKFLFQHSNVVEASFRMINQFFTLERLRSLFNDLLVDVIILSSDDRSHWWLINEIFRKLLLKSDLVSLLTELCAIYVTMMY